MRMAKPRGDGGRSPRSHRAAAVSAAGRAAGDLHERIGADVGGRVSISRGVYRVPETFMIHRQGSIAFKQICSVDEKMPDEVVLPLIKRLGK